jgi:hypothetical protein
MRPLRDARVGRARAAGEPLCGARSPASSAGLGRPPIPWPGIDSQPDGQAWCPAKWRMGRDLNPRDRSRGPPVFKTGAINRSATHPDARLAPLRRDQRERVRSSRPVSGILSSPQSGEGRPSVLARTLPWRSLPPTRPCGPTWSCSHRELAAFHSRCRAPSLAGDRRCGPGIVTVALVLASRRAGVTRSACSAVPTFLTGAHVVRPRVPAARPDSVPLPHHPSAAVRPARSPDVCARRGWTATLPSPRSSSTKRARATLPKPAARVGLPLRVLGYVSRAGRGMPRLWLPAPVVRRCGAPERIRTFGLRLRKPML